MIGFSGNKRKRPSNGRLLKRRKNREAAGTQQLNFVPIERPVVPIPKSSTTVFFHNQRHSFRLPCFYKKKVVILSDSMSKHLPLHILPERGFESVSFSGCDTLEMCLLLNYGKVVSGGEKLLDTQRQNFGLLRKPLPFYENCRHCNQKCHRIFKGHLVLNAFLNTSLKCSNPSFQGQNLTRIFTLLENILQTKFPKATVVYVRPNKPDSLKWRRNPDAVETFDRIVEKLNTKDLVIGDVNFGRDNDAFCGDGIHFE